MAQLSPSLKLLYSIIKEFFCQFFGVFLDQQLQLFDEANNPSQTPNKTILEVPQASLQVIEERHYWISGSRDIFLLNSGDSFASKLSEEEIEELPVEVVFVGHENLNFIVDEERAFDIIIKIIRNMNQMQTSKIYSFPLGQ